jgi:hypothetical protein
MIPSKCGSFLGPENSNTAGKDIYSFPGAKFE